MHAYIVIGHPIHEALIKARKLAKTFGETSYEFSVTKIDEVRSLSQFVKYSFEKPVTIIITDVEAATEEASNAFLKNLEEPQKNLTYILTSSSEEKLIPTIVSRCQIIRLKAEGSTVEATDKDLESFLDMSTGQKFAYLDKIKKRDEATAFIQSLTHVWHKMLVKGKGNLKKLSQSLKFAEKTNANLQANGNVALQLTDFAAKLTKSGVI